VASVVTARGQRWYLTGFGLGVTLVAAVTTLSTFAFGIADNAAGVRLNLLSLGVALAATAASALRILRGSRWRVLAWLWIAALLGTSALLRSALPADELATLPDWSPGPLGFVALAVLLGERVIFMVVVLAANVLIGLICLLEAALPDLTTLVGFGSNAVGVSVFPLAGAVFYRQLERVARATEHDLDVQQELVARSSTATQLAADRAQRSTAIEATIVPLLRSLADGTADPQDRNIRAAARVESARMRRLFAEIDAVDDPMLHEVRATMDAVERHGVAVILESRGQVPALPVALRRAVLEAPMSTLASAVSTARMVIIADARSVSVSVVTDGPPGPQPLIGDHPQVNTNTTTTEGVSWTQSSWQDPS
jgi:hypothetical protein